MVCRHNSSVLTGNYGQSNWNQICCFHLPLSARETIVPERCEPEPGLPHLGVGPSSWPQWTFDRLHSEIPARWETCGLSSDYDPHNRIKIRDEDLTKINESHGIVSDGWTLGQGADVLTFQRVVVVEMSCYFAVWWDYLLELVCVVHSNTALPVYNLIYMYIFVMKHICPVCV